MNTRRVAALLAVVSLLGGCRWDGDDGRDRNPANQPYYVRPADPTQRPADRHKVQGPAFSGAEATFQLVNGSDAVKVSVADLGGAMFEIATAESAKSAPTVQVDGSTVTAGLRATGNPGPAIVLVVLSRDVRWNVQLSGGANEELVDLTGGPGGDIAFVSGTTRAEAILPAGRGTQRVRMSGGASQFAVRLTGNAPARVTASGGAASVTIDGQTHSGVSGTATWIAPTWNTATDRFDIEATAGVSTMTVTHTS